MDNNNIINNIEIMDLTKLSKPELLVKCDELGITKCKSKNRAIKPPKPGGSMFKNILTALVPIVLFGVSNVALADPHEFRGPVREYHRGSGFNPWPFVAGAVIGGIIVHESDRPAPPPIQFYHEPEILAKWPVQHQHALQFPVPKYCYCENKHSLAEVNVLTNTTPCYTPDHRYNRQNDAVVNHLAFQ